VLIRRASCRLLVALALTSVTLFATSAYGQAPESRPGGLESEVAAMKAENAALREQLRKIEEQQRALLELVNRLQRRLDEPMMAEGPPPAQPADPAGAENASVPSTAAVSSTSSFSAFTAFAARTSAPSIAAAPSPSGFSALSALAAPSTPAAPASAPSTPAAPASAPSARGQRGSLMDHLDDHYKDGFILVKTDDDSKFPFLLRLNNTTQFRYINTKLNNDAYTDHLGVVRPVAERNDFSINRSMFTLAGYAFDKRLKFNLVTWTSNTIAAVVVGGFVGWEFSKAFSLQAGYWTVPGTRTLSFTFPYFTQPDRSMADNFFRPGFTQGIWATGEPLKGLNYHVFLGNGLNTLTIPTSKIDTNLLVAGSVWWEPLGNYGPDGKARNMYDDYYASEKPVIRVGTSYTRSREDRFTNLDQSNPENTSMHNSDGVLTFATGAFAPGVTLDEATYRMWAIDGGVKWRRLAVNGQYYFRWLDDFVADGPLPLSSTFDHGAELSMSYFFVPRKLMLYGRTSAVFGQFRNSYEIGGGFKWFFVPDHRVWLTGEALRVHNSPFGGLIYPYNAGMNGWAPQVQLIFNF
jgi:hypothetical protein